MPVKIQFLMATSSSRHNDLSYQIVLRLIFDKKANFDSFWVNISIQSQRRHFPSSSHGLDRVNSQGEKSMKLDDWKLISRKILIDIN